jgi:hypothetical protein
VTSLAAIEKRDERADVEQLRRLRRVGAQPQIRVLAAGEGTTAWPARWPLAEAPPMLLCDGSVDLLVEFHPVDDIRPARLPQPGAAQAPGPPPLLHYQVDPERWPRGIRNNRPLAKRRPTHLRTALRRETCRSKHLTTASAIGKAASAALGTRLSTPKSRSEALRTRLPDAEEPI